MKKFTSLAMAISVFVLSCLIFPQTSYASQKVCAYIDPGTGSLILQMILGILFGGLFVVKLFWHKIKIFFNNLFSKKGKHEKAED